MAVNATAIYRVRPSGSNLNGGGYDASISGAGTDYSRQNAAQASGSAGTATGTTTFVDATASAFTSAMVGNAIWIASGAGFTVGAYFVTAYTSATTVTLDRSPGTGTVAVWKLGGGWADFWTNTTSTTWLVPGNIIYILGSGTPTTAGYGSPDYSPSTFFVPAGGNATAGLITYTADPATPGYTGLPTGGMPLIKAPGLLFHSSIYFRISLLWIYLNGTASGATNGMINVGRSSYTDLVLDQNGYDQEILAPGNSVQIYNVEIFSSVAKRSTNAKYAINGAINTANGVAITKSNIHDCIGPGVLLCDDNTMTGCIIAKNGGTGVLLQGAGYYTMTVRANTIDANAGNGIELKTQADVAAAFVTANIISNHTTGGTFGMTADAGTTAANDRVKGIIDYNTFYNNTTDVNAISYGSHDVHGGSNPFVGQSTENYATTGLAANNSVPYLQHMAGQTTTVVNNAVSGAVQPAGGGGGSVLIGGL